MNWQIGDRAIVNCSMSDIDGEFVTILSGPHYDAIQGFGRIKHFVVDHPDNDENWSYAFPPDNLIPIPDNGSWSELEKTLQWNPTKLVTVENDNEQSL